MRVMYIVDTNNHTVH